LIEEYTVFERASTIADVLTRRRDRTEPPAGQPNHVESSHATDARPVIHDLEAAARLQRPAADRRSTALFVDRVLASDVTLDAYVGGAFDSLACWQHGFPVSLERSAQRWRSYSTPVLHLGGCSREAYQARPAGD